MKPLHDFLDYFSPLTREQFICVASGLAIGLALGVFIAWLAMHLALRRQRAIERADTALRAFRAQSILTRQ